MFAKTDSAKKLCSTDEDAVDKHSGTTDSSDSGKTTGKGDGAGELSFMENLQQYLMNSTLHGLRYVGERHITVFERYTRATADD